MPVPTTLTRPRAAGYAAALSWGDSDDLLLRLAVGPGRQLTVETAPFDDPRVNTDENPEDMRPESGRAFSRNDWSGGEGLDRAHRRDGTDQDFTRYWASQGVDVAPTQPGRPSRIGLLHGTAELDDADVKAVAELDGTVYWTDGDQVVRCPNATASSVTINMEDPQAGQTAQDVTGLAVLGDKVYAALGTSGVHQRDSSGDWTHWSDVAAVAVWAAKGRVLASTGDALYEAAATSTSVLLHTLPSGRTWTAVADAGSAILAAADDGYVYAFTVDPDDASLVLSAQTLIPSEQPTALAATAGVILVGTGQATSAGGRVGRLWLFGAAADGSLTGGRVLRQWGDGNVTDDHAPTATVATRESVFVVLTDTDGDVATWRYHLATGGVSADIRLDGSAGANAGATAVNGRLIVAVDGDAVWRQTDEYVTEGWLISAAADFYTAARKQWVGARLQTPAAITGEVLLEYSTELAALTDPTHSSWRLVSKASESNPGTGIERLLRSITARYLIFKVTLRAGANETTTPFVESVAFRALPDPDEVVVTLPVNVSDQLELPGKRRIRAKGAGLRMWNALKAAEGEDVTLSLWRLGDVIDGQVVSVSTPVTELQPRGSVTVFCQVTVRGKRRGEAIDVSGVTWGVPLWGESLFGGELSA